MAEWTSPKGVTIVGTKEIIPAIALITDIDEETGEPEYFGETEIDYDNQETVRRDGKILFVDDDGGEWTFDQLQMADL